MFTDYPLQGRVLSALAKKGFSAPTPIQAESLPHTLEQKDLLGQARTGTGKTLAFGLPIAHHLDQDKQKGRAPRAFILTPTRELANQVASELEWIASHLQVVAVYGGTGYGKQASDLKRGCDVVVATPGRAIDYLNRGVLDLSEVQIAVLDEADEMLSMGFEKDVELLLAATPSERQTMLFSATLPSWAKKLASEHLRNPVHLNLIKDEAVTYSEVAIETPLRSRLGVLSDLLHAHHGDKAIIFTHTKAEVDDLAKSLSLKGHGAEAIHGDLNQTQRERVLARFRSGQVNALIGTNVAARGLDIPEVDLVVHYRIPNETEAYQHRSGRTGRAGREGAVILLHSSLEGRELSQIERAVGRRFTRGTPPTPDTIQEAKLKGLMSNAQAQSKEDKAQWLDVANDLVTKQDTDTLAGLLALVLGGAPESRSLLNGEEGWVTVEMSGEVRNTGQAVRILKQAGADDIGRIQLASRAAYADVRPQDVEALLAGDNEVEIVRATRVPAFKVERKPNDKRRSHGRKGGNGKFRRRSNEARYNR